MNDNCYPSRDRAHLAALQRKRRARMRRMDYMPSADALAIIEAKRATLPPGTVESTNSAVLDAIVCEWAQLRGTKKPLEPMTTALGSGITPAVRAGAHDFGGVPEFPQASQARAGAYESGLDLPTWGLAWLAESKAKQARQRVVCGARRHRDGQPCKAMTEPGKRRCRFHGGRSTGPRTPEGKARAVANLRQARQGKPPGP